MHEPTIARRSPTTHGSGMPRAPITALVVAALLLPGCSLFFVQPPPPEPMWQRLPDADCTTSRFWPAIDAVTALAQLGQGMLLSPTGQGGRTSSTTDEKVATGVGVALWGISSVVGFARTGRCEDYRRFVRSQTWRPPPTIAPRPAGMPPGWEPPEQRPLPVAPPNQPADPGDAPPGDEAYPAPGGPPPGQERAPGASDDAAPRSDREAAPPGDGAPAPDAAPEAAPDATAPAPGDGPPSAAPSDPPPAPEAG